MKHRFAFFVGLLLAWLAWVGTATKSHAQDENLIVVTTQRLAQNAQTAPPNLSILREETLADLRLDHPAQALSLLTTT